MLLVIDIGNTNITLGVYDGDQLIGHWRLGTQPERLPDEYGVLIPGLLAHQQIDVRQLAGVALASVVPPLTRVFVQFCHSYIGREPLVVDAGTKTGVRIRYDNPREVGADRVVDAAAVQHLYGGPACVVDFGTATTFDAISADGEYLGGAIAPGIVIAAEALTRRTAKLPRVDLVAPPRVIGSNTVHSIQAGLWFGYIGLVEGMVARFKAELGTSCKVVGTGGLAELISGGTRAIEIVDPWLTLKGLRLIHELNRTA
ncbi:MAG TPA: type III pantothenate kinase [Acidobacteriota bacterium]